MRGSDQSGHLVIPTSLLAHGADFVCFPVCKTYMVFAAELTEVFQ